MRQIRAAELRAFVLDRLGLLGPLWREGEAKGKAVALGAWQIDSIRVTGLRNQELAWAARAESPPAAFHDLVYGERALVEHHYPLFAVRREWLPLLLTATTHRTERHDKERRALAPVMRAVLKRIADSGPASPADFESRRIVGGFNTVKATTRALELLHYQRRLQIAGRSANFHRLFDLTERTVPELGKWRRPGKAEYETFLAMSALGVLKAATMDQIARRMYLHFGQWRGARIEHFRALAERLVPRIALPVQAGDLPDRPIYWHAPEDEDGWEQAAAHKDSPVRLVPPLDHLLYSRQRFAELFGHAYKFEAYTPEAKRRFYFAMPIVHGGNVVGLIDAALGGGAWRISGLDLWHNVPAEALRETAHRIALIAGASRVTAGRKLEPEWRRALSGKIALS